MSNRDTMSGYNIQDRIDEIENFISLGGMEYNAYWDFRRELDDLNDLKSEVEGYSGGEKLENVQFIYEDYFTEYCQSLCEDIGDVPHDLPNYIRDNIDWSGVADDLRVDYSEIEYEGRTYLYRVG